MLTYDWDHCSAQTRTFQPHFHFGQRETRAKFGKEKAWLCCWGRESCVFPLRFQAGTLLCWRAQLPSPQSFRSQYSASTVWCIQKLKKTTCMLLVFTCDLTRFLQFGKPFALYGKRPLFVLCILAVNTTLITGDKAQHEIWVILDVLIEIWANSHMVTAVQECGLSHGS